MLTNHTGGGRRKGSPDDKATQMEDTVPVAAPGRGLYDPHAEHDACGIGFVAHVEGRRSHEVLEMALEALCNHAHRGAVADDRKTGDGAGVLTQIPYEFFSRELGRFGIEPPPPGDLAVGQLFLFRQDVEDRRRAMDIIRQVCHAMGLSVLTFRNVPVIDAALGQRAEANRPWMEQVLIRRTAEACEAGDEFERLLYLARKRIMNRARAQGVQRLYVASLSSRTLVYKGLVLAEELTHFYPDLSDPDYKTAIAVFHQRYSTNTAPTWERAQPFRLICHNGEINTLQGNASWMQAREADLAHPAWGDAVRDLSPIIDRHGSDSSQFDNELELLVRSGRDIRHALMMMVPEAWERLPEGEVSPERRAFYRYHSALLEPWDGPAAITFTDGRLVGTILDRNGLRPARYVILDNGYVIASSEVGAVAYSESQVVKKGRLGPGQILCVDTRRGVVMNDEEITRHFATRRPYGQWVEENLLALDTVVAGQASTAAGASLTASHGGSATANGAVARGLRATSGTPPLVNRQASFGYTSEEMVVVLRPMVADGKEPVGSMGDDTPAAAISHLPRPLFHYFKQRFAEVTNPPIDPLREEMVMSLRVLLGRRANLLSEAPEATRLVELASPVLTPAQMAALRNLPQPEFRAATVDAVWQAPAGDDVNADAAGAALRTAVERLCLAAEEAVRNGAAVVVVSDRKTDVQWLPIPSLLTVGAVHHHLIRRGLRMCASIVCESGEPREVHHFAALIGYGANAVHPHLVFETIDEMVAESRHLAGLTVDLATANFVKAVDKGLLKVMSKMGISTLDSYCGAQIFEALGIGPELIETAFVATPSLIGGVGFASVAEDVLAWHAYGYPAGDAGKGVKLVSWGMYKSRRGGEQHLWSPQVVHALHKAARADTDAESLAAYRQYRTLIHDMRVVVRSLLDFHHLRPPVPVEQVESADRILRRFSTAAMSHGALSAEAHETLAIAMNRLGGMSNSGEGGEAKERYFTERASKIKQVASGRFGVTPEYLMSAEELQIKMAQGSKPGEGGQLPGHKVTAEIAVLRLSTPGVALISPPPHHDIYSIEDLAQLIFDLKQVNPEAAVSVKLVSEAGVGTVAAGVAKGHADLIHLSGADGGTGASPLSSIKHAGGPWELGLAETQHTLLLNGLRGRVRVRVDGGFQSGRDVVIGAMLGADEFSFGTAALIAVGCKMARSCHTNTCPVGVATQRADLIAKFPGQPEHLMVFMHQVAEEVRQILASLGCRSLNEVIGHAELLTQAVTGAAASHLDLQWLLWTPDTGQPRRNVDARNPLLVGADLDDRLAEEVLDELADYVPPVRLRYAIANTDRTVGARLSGQLAKRYGNAGLPAGSVVVELEGTAGQSLGAFLCNGIHLHLTGQANDYVGKGLGGGEIVLRPQASTQYAWHENVILGNTALYGATGGALFAAGRAGERFAVRNSGASAVVEGVGDHGCEYMTGGAVVILGETGRNFGAGMTGGLAYVYDPADVLPSRYNPQLITLRRVQRREHEKQLRAVLRQHAQLTGSPRAKAILDDWNVELSNFWLIVPKEAVAAIEAVNEGAEKAEK